jgi:Phosphotransferase enzyme family
VRPDHSDLDLLSNPVLRKEIPGIEEAFDEPQMRQYLNRVLLAESGGRYTVQACVPGHATYLPGGRCLLRYEIELHDHDGGNAIPAVVNARLFGKRSDSQKYFMERLEPLVETMRGRPETACFTQPAATVSPLNMVASVFPIDGELPTLVGATHPSRILSILENALPEVHEGLFNPRTVRVRLGHYGRQHRCLLKYEIDGTIPPADNERSVLVYGKVAADGRGASTEPVIGAIRDMVLAPSSDGFAIPRSFGFIPDLQLVLLESIPGVPRVAQLLKARFKGKDSGDPSEVTLEESIDSCARVAALLHTSPVSVGLPRGADDELAMLDDALAMIQGTSPGLGLRFERWLDAVRRYEASSVPSAPCFCHGDFSYTQLIFEKKRCGLVDFDTMCQAEAALDLGQFLAYLRVAMMKSLKTPTHEDLAATEALCGQFLDTYSRRCGLSRASAVLERVPLYELISLMRLAFHSWQKFKSSRLEYVIAVLEQRLEYHAIGSAK